MVPLFITEHQKKSKIKSMIFLCDLVNINMALLITRTICFKPKKYIKNIFIKVLKGHIAVATSDAI